MNNYKNVEILKIGLSNANFTDEIKIASSYPLKRTRKRQSYSSYGGDLIKERVEFRTLDSFNLKPAVIKIDTDGFEFRILKGAEQTLKDNKPAIILELIDKTLAKKGDSKNQLVDYLHSIGYDFFTLEFEPIADPNNYHSANVIALHRSSSKT